MKACNAGGREPASADGGEEGRRAGPLARAGTATDDRDQPDPAICHPKKSGPTELSLPRISTAPRRPEKSRPSDDSSGGSADLLGDGAGREPPGLAGRCDGSVGSRQG